MIGTITSIKENLLAGIIQGKDTGSGPIVFPVETLSGGLEFGVGLLHHQVYFFTNDVIVWGRVRPNI